MCPTCCGMARWYGSGHGGRTWQSGSASTRGQNDTGRPCQLRSYTATVALLHVTLHSRQSACTAERCTALRDCMLVGMTGCGLQTQDDEARCGGRDGTGTWLCTYPCKPQVGAVSVCIGVCSGLIQETSWGHLTVIEDGVACQHPYPYGCICKGQGRDEKGEPNVC